MEPSCFVVVVVVFVCFYSKPAKKLSKKVMTDFLAHFFTSRSVERRFKF